MGAFAAIPLALLLVACSGIKPPALVAQPVSTPYGEGTVLTTGVIAGLIQNLKNAFNHDPNSKDGEITLNVMRNYDNGADALYVKSEAKNEEQGPDFTKKNTELWVSASDNPNVVNVSMNVTTNGVRRFAKYQFPIGDTPSLNLTSLQNVTRVGSGILLDATGPEGEDVKALMISDTYKDIVDQAVLIYAKIKDTRNWGKIQHPDVLKKLGIGDNTGQPTPFQARAALAQLRKEHDAAMEWMPETTTVSDPTCTPYFGGPNGHGGYNQLVVQPNGTVRATGGAVDPKQTVCAKGARGGAIVPPPPGTPSPAP